MNDAVALSVAFSPGVTVTKWTRIWAERHPQTPLTILPTDLPNQLAVVHDGTAQLSFVRLPIDESGLHVIQLYRERAVAVAAKDHLISAADQVTLADLADEKLLSAGTTHAERDVFDLVAAGVGVLIVPQSIARLQSRKDVVVRPILDAPETEIALAWSIDQDSSALAELTEEFIGIVRGRTARSSRGDSAEEAARTGQSSAAKSRSAARSTTTAQPKTAGKPKAPPQGKAAALAKAAAQARKRKQAAARKKHRGR